MIQIDFTQLKRIPTSEDIKKASDKLIAETKKIISDNESFFSEGNHTKRIDFIITPNITSNSGLIQYPYPQVSFPDYWLSDKIKLDTTAKFYELLFEIINSDE